MEFAQRHWRSNLESGHAGVAPSSVTGSQCQLPGAPVEGYCSLQRAPILLMSITLRLSQTGRERLGRDSKGAREPGLCSAVSPKASGAHWELGRSCRRGPPTAGALLPPRRLDSGRGPGGWARRPPASRLCESLRAGPAPTPTNSALPGNRRREGPPGQHERT